VGTVLLGVLFPFPFFFALYGCGDFLFFLAFYREFLEQPTQRRPFPSLVRSGVCPAVLFLAFALAWLWHLGPGF